MWLCRVLPALGGGEPFHNAPISSSVEVTRPALHTNKPRSRRCRTPRTAISSPLSSRTASVPKIENCTPDPISLRGRRNRIPQFSHTLEGTSASHALSEHDNNLAPLRRRALARAIYSLFAISAVATSSRCDVRTPKPVTSGALEHVRSTSARPITASAIRAQRTAQSGPRPPTRPTTTKSTFDQERCSMTTPATGPVRLWRRGVAGLEPFDAPLNIARRVSGAAADPPPPGAPTQG